MEPADNSLESDYEASPYSSSLEASPGVMPQLPEPNRRNRYFSTFRYNKLAFVVTGVALLFILLVGAASLLLSGSHKPANSNQGSPSANYAVGNIPLDNVKGATQLQVGEADYLAVNGRLQVGNTLILTPTASPTTPTAGQIYYDQKTNAPYYYNGSQFISLAPTALPQLVNSLGGTSGNIGVGGGLQITAGQLTLTAAITQALSARSSGVTSFQGQVGAVSLTAGNGIDINGTTITNTGVLGSGTAGNIPLFNGAQTVGDSILSQSGLNLTAGGNLTVTGAVTTDTLQHSTTDLSISAGSNHIVFTDGSLSFKFPTGLVGPQVICTTTSVCASGSGSAVLLQPGTAQADSGAGSSVFINNTGGGNLLRLQGNTSDKFVVTNSGNATLSGNLTVSSLGAGLVQSNGSGTLSSGAVDRNSATLLSNTLNVGNGGTGATTFTSNGIVYGNGSGALSVTAAGADAQFLLSNGGTPVFRSLSGDASIINTGALTINKLQGITLSISALGNGDVLQVSGGNIVNGHITNNNLTIGIFGNITGTGALTSGSIGGAFGTISTGNNISTTATLQGNIDNATTGFEIGGTAVLGHYLRGNGTNYVDSALQAADISGTLFTLAASVGSQAVASGATVSVLKGASNNLTTTASATDTVTVDIRNDPTFTQTVTANNSIGVALAVSGTPTAGLTTSLLQLGGAIVSGNNVANGGTYVGINEPNTGAGLAADFLNFQVNGTYKLKVNNTGLLDAVGGLAVNGTTVLTSGKALQNLTGLSSTGTITFSGLNVAGGVVHTDGSGTLSSSKVLLGTETNGNYVDSIGSVTGLTLGGTNGVAGAVPTLSVNYGSAANTAAQGNTALSFTGSGNLQGTVSGTAGSGFTSNTLDVIPNPTFTGTLSVSTAGVINVGVQNTTTGKVNFGTLANNNGLTSLQATGPTSSGLATITIPGIPGATSDMICLFTLGNCAGSGGGLTGTGTGGKIAKYGGVGASTTLADSSLSDNGSTVTASGNVAIQGANSLTLGVAATARGSIAFNNAALGATHTVTIQAPATDPTSSFSLTLPTAGGANGDCLKSDGGAPNATLTFTACTGGAGGGVTYILGTTSGSANASGIVTFNNALTTSSTITIDNAKADASTKGIATFNATNFSDNGSGTINTIQNIATSSSPSFTAQTLTGNTTGLSLTGTPAASATSSLVRVGSAIAGGNNAANGGTYLGINEPSSGAGSAADFLNFQLNGTSKLKVTNAGDITAGLFNTASISGGTLSAGTFSGGSVSGGSLSATLVNGLSVSGGTITSPTITGTVTGSSSPVITGFGTYNGQTISSSANFTGTLAVQGAGGLTIGNTTGNVTGLLKLVNDTNSNLATLRVKAGGVAQPTTYNLPDPGISGTADICLSSGNCGGSGVTLQAAYDNSPSAQIVLNNSPGAGALVVRDNATPLVGNLFAVQSNNGTSTYLGVTSSGITTSGTVNTATISGGTLSGGTFSGGSVSAGTISGGTLSATAVNSLNVGANAISTGSGNLTIDANGSGTVSVGGLSTGDILLGGGSGSTGCTVTNSNGNFNCSGTLTIQGTGASTIAGSLGVQGSSLTVGTTTQQGSLILNDGNGGSGTNHTATVQSIATLGQDTTYVLRDPGSVSVDICLSTGNCAGSGTGVTATTPGTANYVAKFTAGQNISNSQLFDNNTNVGLNVISGFGTNTRLTVNANGTANNNASTQLNAGAAGQQALVIQGAASQTADLLQLQDSTGTVLAKFDASGNLTAAGATITGTTNINTSGTANTSIGNATGTFAVTSNALNITSAGAISGVTTISASGAITAATSGNTINGLIISSGALSGVASISSSGSYTQTGSGANTFSGATTISAAGTALTVNNNASIGGTLAVQGASATIGTVSQAGTLVLNDGNGGSNKTATLQAFATLGQNTTYTLPDPGQTTVNICLSTGNCAGAGTGVTTTGGTINTIAMFTGSQAIGNSILSQDAGATILTVSGALTASGNINTASGQYQVGGTQISSANLSNDANLAKLNGTGPQTFTGNNKFTGTFLDQNAADSTTAFQIQQASGTNVLNVDTTNSITSLRGSNSDATLGSELFTGSESFPATGGWTSISGTGSSATATHTAGGGTTALSPTPALTITAGQTYQVSFTISNTPTTGEYVTPSIGGTNGKAITGVAGNETQLITAGGTGNLAFTPTTNWNGTITTVSIKPITISNAVLQVKNSGATTVLEVRASSSATNTFIGLSAGQSNTGGTNNTALGTSALQSNTTGNVNTAVGWKALQLNTTGSGNVAVGEAAMLQNTTGFNSTAIGAGALEFNTTGYDNNALGDSALLNNTTGYFNTASGASALYYNTTGASNSAYGISALAYNTTGSNNVGLGFSAGNSSIIANANTTGSNNTFLGYNSGPGSTTQLQNATAIGTYATVNQNDSLVLGCINGVNGCTANTQVGIGTAAPAYKLDVRNTTTDPSAAVIGTYLQNTPTLTANNAQSTFALDAENRTSANAFNNGSVTGSTSQALGYQLSGGTTTQLTAAYDISLVQAASTGAYTTVIGANGVVNHQGTGTITTAYGTIGQVQLNSAGAITTGYGTYSRLLNLGSGTITTGYGTYVASPTNSGGGAITTNYGAYIAPQAAAGISTAYGLYQAGANDLNQFQGVIGLGVTPTTGSGLLQLAAGADAAHGILFGSDTNLYRSAAGLLQTDGGLTVKGAAGLTLGVAGTTAGSLVFNNASNAHITTLQGLAAAGQDQVITIPASSATTDTVCLLTLSNCVGAGGAVSTTGGTQNFITKYNNAGATQITKSQLFDNNTNVGLNVISGFGTNTRLTVNANGTANNNAVAQINANNAAYSGLVVQGTTSQTADLYQNQNNTGAVLSEFTSSGALQGGNASGTDVAGTNLVLNGGQGTGTGNGGTINFQIAKAGTSGSSPNALTTVASLSGTNGAALFQNSANSTTALQVQNAVGDQLLNIDTATALSTQQLVNPSIEQSISGNWQVKGSATVSQDSTQAYIGNKSLKIVTTATANDGTLQNKTLADSTTYTLTFEIRMDASSAVFANPSAGYSSDGTTDSSCGSIGGAISTSWTRVSCTFTTPASHSGTPYVYIKQSDAVARTFYIDAVQLQTGSTANAFQDGLIALNGVVNSPAVFKNAADSNTSFQVQNAAGTSLLTADTASRQISLAAGLNQKTTDSLVTAYGGFSGTYTNLLSNPSFEGNSTTGWSTFGTNTIAADTAQSLHGSYSLKATYQNDLRLAAGPAMTLSTSTTYSFTVWVYIPSSWDGGPITMGDDGTFAGATKTTSAADLNLRDQWQRLTMILTTAADNTGGIFLRASSLAPPSAGMFVYFDNAQVTATSMPMPFSPLTNVAVSPGLTTSGNITALGNNFLARNATDSTTAFQIQQAGGTNVLSVDTTNSQLAVRGINSDATLGSELITLPLFNDPSWTTTNWTLSGGNTLATHTTGNTSALSTTQVAVTAGQTYQVKFVVTGNPTAGETITPNIGGVSSRAISGNDAGEYQLITATTTGNLQFIPTSNWNGIISAVSVKLVTASNAALTVLNSSGGTALEVRAPIAAADTFVGLNAGRSNTTGTSNTAFGSSALMNNSIGAFNTATGAAALISNTVGTWNTALGGEALYFNTTGNYNVATGVNALEFNTTGSYNAATGLGALQGNTNGNKNVALGAFAGYTGTAANANTSGSDNTFIGYNSGPGSPTQLQNATAIGTYATVNQSDSLVLGCISGVNGCTTSTSVGIGTATPAATLNVVGTGTFTSPTGNSTNAFQIQNASSAVIFNVDTTTTSNLITNGGFEDGPQVTGWTAKGSAGAPTQSSAQQWQGNSSLSETTTATAGDGVKYAFTFTNTQQYTLSFYLKLSSGSWTNANLEAGRADNGSTDTPCVLSPSTAPSTSNWTKYSCTFTAGAQSGSPYLYIKQLDATLRTFFIDGVQLQTGATPTAFNPGGAIQLNGLINSPVAIQNKSDSTNVFQIQNAAGTSNLLVADTINTQIGIGASPATSLLTIGTNTTAASGGITFGTDTSLYRSGGNQLTTGGALFLGGGVNSGGVVTANNNTSTQVKTGSDGTNGSIQFGNPVDVKIFRAGAGALTLQGVGSVATTFVTKAGSSQSTTDLLQLQDNNGNVNAAFNSTGATLTLGKIAATNFSQGKLILADGTSDTFGLTVNTNTLLNNRTYSFPDSAGNATDTICLQTLANCAGSGSGVTATGYTQNYLTKFNGTSNQITVSQLFDNGSNAGLNVASGFGTNTRLTINGNTTNTNNGVANNNAVAQINTGVATNTGLVVQAIGSQTADIFQIQDSTGSNIQRTDASGNQEQLGYFNNGIGGIGQFANLITYSEQFDNVAWANSTGTVTVTANNGTAPDAQSTADTLTTANSGALTQTSATAAGSNTFTFSVWLKTSSGTQTVGLRLDANTNGAANNVTATTTWQRFNVSRTFSGATGNAKVTILPGGAGASGTVIAWGAQLVQQAAASGISPQVYVRTTTNAAAQNQGVVSNGGLYAVSLNANDVPLTVQAAPSQSGNLLNVTDSANNVLASVSSAGALTAVGVNAGAGLLQGSGGLTLTGTAQINNAAGSGSTSINSGSSTGTISIGNSSSGSIAIQGGNTSTAITLKTAASGTLSLGDNGVASTVQIGNTSGAVAQTINIGNNASGSSSTAITIGNTNGGNITLQSAATINIGQNAASQTLNIGNANGTSGIVERVGTGNYSLDGVGASTYALGASTVAGTITVGGTAQTGNLTLGQSTATNTINIGNATIAAGNIGTVNIGTSSTSTGKTVTTIGSTNGTSSLTLQAGTGNINLSPSGASNSGVVLKPGADSNSVLLIQSVGVASVLQVNTVSQTDVQGGTDNGALGINGASVTAGYALNVTGSINATAIYDGGVRVCTSTGCAPVAGSSNYIQNSTTTQTGNANFNIQTAAGNVGGIIKGSSSQTADLLQFQSSTGTVLSEITASGAHQGGNASGTDAAGTNLVLNGGQGTGTGNGGNIVLQIAKPGTTGSSLNGLSTVASFSGTNGAALFQNTTNSTTAFQIQQAGGTNVLSVDTLNSLTSVRGINSDAIIGPELITLPLFNDPSWTTTNWTLSGGNTLATHTTGNTSALSTTQVAVTAGQTYQVTFTVTGNPTAGETITPNIGGVNGKAISGNAATQVQLITATTTGGLQFIPTSNWNGIISAVSVKLVTASNAALTVLNSSGGTALEVRSATGVNDIFIGTSAGQSNTTGIQNTAVGALALQNNTIGFRNSAFGYEGLFQNTTGASNNAFGYAALASNTTSNSNNAFGTAALSLNTTGANNSAFGQAVLFSNTTGTGNTALGYQAGLTATGANANTTGSNNTFIGYNSGPGSPTQLQNATAIGTYSTVNQNNSLVLGCINTVNGCTATTQVGIGTATPAATLNVVGTGTFTSPTGNSTNAFQIQNASSAVIFNVDSTTTSNLITNGGFEDGPQVTGWTAKGSAGAPAQTSAQQWQGNSALSETTTAAANDGTKYAFTFTNTQQYTLSFYLKLSSGSWTNANLEAGRADNGSTDTPCVLSPSTAPSTSNWTKYSCTFTAGAQSGSPYLYIKQLDATLRTFFIDGVQLQTGATPTAFNPGGAIQLNGLINSPVAIQNKTDSTAAFTIQNSAGTSLLNADTQNMVVTIGSPTTAQKSGNSLLVAQAEVTGQIYVGNASGGMTISSSSINAYEPSLSGTARHQKKFKLTAEYAGAVLDTGGAGSTTGSMTSGFDSGQRESYYNWTTTQAGNNTYDVVVQIPLPSDFAAFNTTTPITVDRKTSDTTNGTILATLTDTAGTAVTNWNTCSLTPGATTWTTTAGCTISSGTFAADGVLTLRLHIQAQNNGNTQIGNITLNYLSSY